MVAMYVIQTFYAPASAWPDYSEGHVLCSGQAQGDFCDCTEVDCLGNPQWCQCAEARECCSGIDDYYDYDDDSSSEDCADYISKDNANCASGFQDLPTTSACYGSYCMQCTGNTAGLDGEC